MTIVILDWWSPTFFQVKSLAIFWWKTNTTNYIVKSPVLHQQIVRLNSVKNQLLFSRPTDQVLEFGLPWSRRHPWLRWWHLCRWLQRFWPPSLRPTHHHRASRKFGDYIFYDKILDVVHKWCLIMDVIVLMVLMRNHITKIQCRSNQNFYTGQDYKKFKSATFFSIHFT